MNPGQTHNYHVLLTINIMKKARNKHKVIGACDKHVQNSTCTTHKLDACKKLNIYLTQK